MSRIVMLQMAHAQRHAAGSVASSGLHTSLQVRMYLLTGIVVNNVPLRITF